MRDGLLIVGACLALAAASWVISLGAWPVIGISVFILIAVGLAVGGHLIDLWDEQ